MRSKFDVIRNRIEHDSTVLLAAVFSWPNEFSLNNINFRMKSSGRQAPTLGLVGSQ